MQSECCCCGNIVLDGEIFLFVSVSQRTHTQHEQQVHSKNFLYTKRFINQQPTLYKLYKTIKKKDQNQKESN